MRAFIYVGGGIDPAYVTEHPKGDDLILAADGGMENANLLGVKPQIIVGDFDSYDKDALPKEREILQVPAEKDETDTQLCVDLALQRGATELVLIGGLSGRLDHTLANLGILEDLDALGVHAYMTDGYNRVRFLRSTSTLIVRSPFRYLSLLAVDDVVKGVSVEGGKYPLKNARLSRRRQCLTVSNEITGNVALIDVKKGGVLIIESRDAIKK